MQSVVKITYGQVGSTSSCPEGGAQLYGSAPPAALAAAMHKAWVDFATTGRPGWAAYTLDARPTMTFDVDCAVIDDPRAARRAVWDLIR